jgi:hypothetical protein
VAAQRGAIVTGLDFAEEMIAVASVKGLGARNFALEMPSRYRSRMPYLTASSAISESCIWPSQRKRWPRRACAQGRGRYAFTVWRGSEVARLFRIDGLWLAAEAGKVGSDDEGDFRFDIGQSIGEVCAIDSDDPLVRDNAGDTVSCPSTWPVTSSPGRAVRTLCSNGFSPHASRLETRREGLRGGSDQ